jgi:hypothetical protein
MVVKPFEAETDTIRGCQLFMALTCDVRCGTPSGPLFVAQAPSVI